MESAQIGSDQHSTGTFGSRSSGPVSFVTKAPNEEPVHRGRGRPRKGEPLRGQTDQKPKRQNFTIGDWGFWLVPKTPERSATYAPTQTAVSESWHLRGHIAASDHLNPNWRIAETDISNLLNLFLATANAHAIAQSNQERTLVHDQILFLGDLGQEVYMEINRHMRLIRSGLQEQDSDAYSRGLRWLRLAAPVILQIASVYCRQTCRMTSFEMKRSADQTPSGHPSIDNSMIPGQCPSNARLDAPSVLRSGSKHLAAGTVTTQPSSGHHIAPATSGSIDNSIFTGSSHSTARSGDLTHSHFDLTCIAAGTANTSVGPSAFRPSSQSTAQTGGVVPQEKLKRVRMPFEPHTTDDGVWTYNLTKKPTESFSPDVNAVAYLRTLGYTIRSLDKRSPGWRAEGSSGKKDFEDLVELILAT